MEIKKVNFYESPVVSGTFTDDDQWCCPGAFVKIEVDGDVVTLFDHDIDGSVNGWIRTQHGKDDIITDILRRLRDDESCKCGSNGYYVEFSETDLTNKVPVTVIYRPHQVS